MVYQSTCVRRFVCVDTFVVPALQDNSLHVGCRYCIEQSPDIQLTHRSRVLFLAPISPIVHAYITHNLDYHSHHTHAGRSTREKECQIPMQACVLS